MALAQKPDCLFRWKGRVDLNRQGRRFSRLLAAEVCASALVMLDTPCSVVVWRVLATHSIRQFPLHLPSRASCAITFQLDSTTVVFRWTLGRIKDTAVPIHKQGSIEACERHGFQDPWPNIPRQTVAKQFLSVCELSNVLKFEADKIESSCIH